MFYSSPVTELIKRRYSCRTYSEQPIADDKRQRMHEFLAANTVGPLGSRARFTLVAASADDRSELRWLHTYGFIKGATGFIIGAARPGGKSLEDYGYLMERAILLATDLGLGTCWLGGTFTRSSFAAKIGARRGEVLPAVTAVGNIARRDGIRGTIRGQIGADNRLPWEALFFAGGLSTPLTVDAAGAYAVPLEMVRLGPSASNKQPWRVVKDGNAWHFYLCRTPGYAAGKLVSIADVQRLDLGIAMCHFELSARELGLSGAWTVRERGIERPSRLTEYTASWLG